MLQILIFLLASVIGYIFLYFYSHPKSFIHKRLPKLKIKSFQFFPSMTITISGKVIHLHHWIGFSIILVVSIFVNSGILSYIFTKGLLSGGILQGVFTPRSFRLIYKKEDS